MRRRRRSRAAHTRQPRLTPLARIYTNQKGEKQYMTQIPASNTRWPWSVRPVRSARRCSRFSSERKFPVGELAAAGERAFGRRQGRVRRQSSRPAESCRLRLRRRRHRVFLRRRKVSPRACAARGGGRRGRHRQHVGIPLPRRYPAGRQRSQSRCDCAATRRTASSPIRIARPCRCWWRWRRSIVPLASNASTWPRISRFPAPAGPAWKNSAEADRRAAEFPAT